VVAIEFGDGSEATIHYVASGDRSFSKERVEIFGGGCVAVLDDFRRLELVRHGKKQTFRSWLKQDKGHRAEWQAFADCIRTGQPAPISFDEIFATTLATLRIVDSLRTGQELAVTGADTQLFTAPLVS